MMFRTLSDRTTIQMEGSVRIALSRATRIWWYEHTLIFPDIFQSEREVGIFPLHNPHFSKGAAAHDTQESEMVEVHLYRGQEVSKDE